MVRTMGRVLTVLLLASATAARAQEPVSGDGHPAWGQATTRVTIPALAMVPLTATTAYGAFNTSRSCDGGAACGFTAPLQLPTGAVLQRIDLEGCDLSTSDNIGFSFYHCDLFPNGGCLLLAQQFTGTPQVPGCGEFGADVNVTVDNSAKTYQLIVAINGTGNDVYLRAVRATYALQVSPPPAAATFGDVPPQHGFFRFVEALAASGITGGCGSGNFCPDQPVTRGQMAVFLASALGLHWPN